MLIYCFGKRLVSEENVFTKTSQCVDNQAICLNIILKYKLRKKNTVQSFVEFLWLKLFIKC